MKGNAMYLVLTAPHKNHGRFNEAPRICHDARARPLKWKGREGASPIDSRARATPRAPRTS